MGGEERRGEEATKDVVRQNYKIKFSSNAESRNRATPPQNPIEMLARRAFYFRLRYFILHLAKALQRPLPPRSTDGPSEQVLDAQWRPCWFINSTVLLSATVSLADPNILLVYCFLLQFVCR